MKKTILGFEIKKEKVAAVQKLCDDMGIELVHVAPKDYGKALGSLANVQDFKDDGKAKNTTAAAKAFPMEMLVFSGFNSEALDEFIGEYRKRGIEKISLRAVITPTNIFWSPQELFSEILKEHMFFANKNK